MKLVAKKKFFMRQQLSEDYAKFILVLFSQVYLIFLFTFCSLSLFLHIQFFQLSCYAETAFDNLCMFHFSQESSQFQLAKCVCSHLAVLKCETR